MPAGCIHIGSDVFYADIPQGGQTDFRRHVLREDAPMFRDFAGIIIGNLTITEFRKPVQLETEDFPYIGHLQVFHTHILDRTAASAGGFDPKTEGGAVEGTVVDINAADPAGHIGAQGDPLAGLRQMTDRRSDVFTDAVHTKPDPRLDRT